MPRKSKLPGKSISVAEIQNISNHGIWIFIKDQELFLSFIKYPWFKKATIDEIYNFKCHKGKYLHWPKLDIDLDIESIKHPEKYPLEYK